MRLITLNFEFYLKFDLFSHSAFVFQRKFDLSLMVSELE